MSKTVVVYHSGYGHTQRIAQSVAEGAQAKLIAISPEGEISKAEWEDLNQAQAIIFGSPTYMGTVSWQFKRWADSTSKQWMSGAWKDKVAGGFTISSQPSGDKLSTLQYFITLSMQLGMVWVGQTLPNDGNLNRLGSASGLMSQVGATSPASEIPAGDLETARAYGQRVLEMAHRLHRN